MSSVLAALVVLGACATSAPSPTPAPGLTPSQLADCRRACDQQQFFDCYDAAAHGTCYDHCDLTTAPQAERFVACVGNGTCDVACGEHIDPDAAAPTPATSAPPTCEDLCLEYLDEGCAPGFDASDCAVACDEARAMVTSCLGARDGCSLSPACEAALAPPSAPPDETVEDCEDHCQDLGFFQCITPLDVVTCDGRCSTAPQNTVEQFNTCMDAALGCDGAACYTLLDPAGPSADVQGCQDACDQMAAFDCLTPGQQATCRTTCTTATATAVDDFIACNVGICSDETCWLQLEAAR